MRRAHRSREVRRITELARDQHGVVARTQLLGAGISRHAIDGHLATGWLTVVFRGVFLVGPPVDAPRHRDMAAVLAGGREALLSHRSAAALHGIAPAGSRPEITLIAGDRRPPEITCHRTARLDPREAWVRDGIPVTAPARTVIDLATIVDPRELSRAYEEAIIQCRLRPRQVVAALARAPKHRSSRRIRALLASGAEPRLTRSEAERRLIELIREAGLPEPQTNVRLHGYEVDAYWPDRRLVVEVDGYAFHGHRAAFERDARRGTVLTLAGERILRITWRELIGERLRVAGEVGLALGAP